MLDDNFGRYAIDGKISRTGSRVFATQYAWSQYFLLQLDSLTNVIGVTITSRDEDNSNVTHSSQNTGDPYMSKESGIQSIKDVVIRAGTTKMEGLCIRYEDGIDGNNITYGALECRPSTDLDWCGILQVESDILPLREYSVICEKSLLARVVTVEQPRHGTSYRSLTFEEISVIRGNFLDKSAYSGQLSSIHGSSGMTTKFFSLLSVVTY